MESAPIIFTSGLESMERGDWDGIWLIDADPASRFEYCYFLLGAKYGRRYHYRTVNEQLDSTLWEYGAVTCIRSSPTISRCWFLDNGFHGLHCDTSSNPLVEYSIFYNNAGHGVYVDTTADPQIRYNIITENDDYGLFCRQEGNDPRPDIQLDYNIVWSNFSGEFNQMAPTMLGRKVQYNGNLDACDYRFNLRLNPSFKDAEWGDFRLYPWSAAIDAGPDDPGQQDPDGTRIDLGIYTYEYRPGEIRRLITVDRLKRDQSPYFMSCDVYLPRDQTLVIEDGVEVLVEGLFSFDAYGLLRCEGTEDNPVVFRSALVDATVGDWIGLIFNSGGAEGTVLEYTRIVNATNGLYFSQRDARIENCIIEKSSYAGIFCENNADPQISDSRLYSNSFAGIYCEDNSSPRILRVVIQGGEGYGIHATLHSMPIITNTIIYDVKTSGIRLEDLSNATIINNTILMNGYYGINCDANSSPEIRNNIIVCNGTEQRGGIGVLAARMSNPIIEYNCFWAHPSSSVEVSSDTTFSGSNILTDPLFVSLNGGDFHLKQDSPCLVHGDPHIDSQMGAYGGPDAAQ
ncbi:right-handed parallel beta-helix repeat-containing protein [bacterium]|nr:right-handed parallel beta-helix repeat-containing protein [bacterium]